MPLIEVTLIEGRSPEALRALMRRLTDAAEETIAAPRGTIRVVLREVPATHWAVGGEPKG
jgi:4-oxalocrotonate tautomerase